jgi:hypothetical protein
MLTLKSPRPAAPQLLILLLPPVPGVHRSAAVPAATTTEAVATPACRCCTGGLLLAMEPQPYQSWLQLALCAASADVGCTRWPPGICSTRTLLAVGLCHSLVGMCAVPAQCQSRPRCRITRNGDLRPDTDLMPNSCSSALPSPSLPSREIASKYYNRLPAVLSGAARIGSMFSGCRPAAGRIISSAPAPRWNNCGVAVGGGLPLCMGQAAGGFFTHRVSGTDHNQSGRWRGRPLFSCVLINHPLMRKS